MTQMRLCPIFMTIKCMQSYHRKVIAMNNVNTTNICTKSEILLNVFLAESSTSDGLQQDMRSWIEISSRLSTLRSLSSGWLKC